MILEWKQIDVNIHRMMMQLHEKTSLNRFEVGNVNEVAEVTFLVVTMKEFDLELECFMDRMKDDQHCWISLQPCFK